MVAHARLIIAILLYVCSGWGGVGVESVMDILLSPFFNTIALILALILLARTPDDALILLGRTSDDANRPYAAIIEGDGIHLPDNATQPTRDLVIGILLRNISLDGVRRLISLGADVNVLITQTVRATQVQAIAQVSMRPRTHRKSILSLAIDTRSSCSPLGVFRLRWPGSITLPVWPTRELQAAIMHELISAGAHVDGQQLENVVPIRIAKDSLNMTAVEVLLDHNAAVRSHPSRPLSNRLPFIHGEALAGFENLEEAEDTLFNISARLLQRDSSLATEREGLDGHTTVHSVCRVSCVSLSRSFVGRYLDMLVQHGASLTQADRVFLLSVGGSGGLSPLHQAALTGNHSSVVCLLDRIPSTEIHRTALQQGNPMTALAWAAQGVDFLRIVLRPIIRERIDDAKRCIRTLLRHGASVADTPQHQLDRARILQEYAVMLNELPQVVEHAINAALEPQRDIAARIGCLLPMVPHHDDGTDQPVEGETCRLTYKHHGEPPHRDPRDLTFGPCEATSIAWKIGAFLHDPSAARAVIDEYLIGDSRLKRRVSAAVDHFVKQAATRTASNREVVGKTEKGEGGRPEGALLRWWNRLRGVTGAGQGGLTVRVPALQCFAIHGGGRHPHRRLGVREVVHRARLDEAAAYRVRGVVKGFNSHLGDTDCRFRWGQLGYIDQPGCFVSLGIN
ncbi:unnamed protein product [Vitrella brassicaformis CCMP3155]|uniref:Uncharacterized protein n=1 Tax=Vitrella brassicaformis (strain CCMP3155) TaxID=1169540 RepID=A0A0G4G032_VITBC|nr:unnamed protein product [Vitrella brassicaformis CCMP3155]|eukprot:CEM20872.1 unnamed protein product [Vitrella brassicaformis CCMP3155]